MKHIAIKVGDIAYLVHRKVVICEILSDFQLIAVHYEGEKYTFYIDHGALSQKPACYCSIPITIFRGERP